MNLQLQITALKTKLRSESFLNVIIYRLFKNQQNNVM